MRVVLPAADTTMPACAATSRRRGVPNCSLVTNERKKPIRVGTMLVCPPHGVGKVTARRKVDGQDMVEIVCSQRGALDVHVAHNDLTILKPLSLLEESGVRHPMPADEALDVLEVMDRANVSEPQNWSRRQKNYEEKLNSGDPMWVAEVARNITLRMLTKEEKKERLSHNERKLWRAALDALSAEMSLSLKQTQTNVEERLLRKVPGWVGSQSEMLWKSQTAEAKKAARQLAARA